VIVPPSARAISREEAIAEFRRLALLSQTPLGAIDLPNGLWFALRRHFGSIDKAREAAGVAGPDLTRRWSRETVIDELRRLHRAGVRITDLGMKDDHADVLGAIREYFDGIVEARRAARIPEPAPLVHGKRQRWDEIRVVAEIEERHRSGESLAASKIPNPLLKAGKRYFGNWGTAIEAAGLDYDEIRLQREPYTEEELIDILRKLSRKQPDMLLGELGTQSYFATVLRLFGSLEAALERARIRDWPQRARMEAMSRADALEALRQRERAGKSTKAETVRVEDHLLWHSGLVYFAEWHQFAKAAGVDTSSYQRAWTPERLLDALRERDRRGLSLKPEHVRQDDDALYQSVIVYFGSYLEGVSLVADTPWALTRWSRELVIERLQALARKHKRKRILAREAGTTLVGRAQRYFGSYSEACRAAGLEYSVCLGRRPRTRARTLRKSLDSGRERPNGGRRVVGRE
jgi:hypothetical protein